jgi:hypothetical protein
MRRGWRWLGGMEVAVVSKTVGRGGGGVAGSSEGEARGEEARVLRSKARGSRTEEAYDRWSSGAEHPHGSGRE